MSTVFREMRETHIIEAIFLAIFVFILYNAG